MRGMDIGSIPLQACGNLQVGGHDKSNAKHISVIMTRLIQGADVERLVEKGAIDSELKVFSDGNAITIDPEQHILKNFALWNGAPKDIHELVMENQISFNSKMEAASQQFTLNHANNKSEPKKMWQGLQAKPDIAKQKYGDPQRPRKLYLNGHTGEKLSPPPGTLLDPNALKGAIVASFLVIAPLVFVR